MKPAPLHELHEREWQQQVIQLAHTLGWRVAHFRPAKTEHGWRTPVQADGAGFPDCVLVRERVIWIELKREKTKLTEEQKAWMEALHAAGAEAYVARPRHLDALAQILQHRGTDAHMDAQRLHLETVAEYQPTVAATRSDQLSIDEETESFGAWVERLAAQGGQAR